MGICKKGTREKLEKIYHTYPRKLGKTKGFNSAMAQCKTDEDLELLQIAIHNYRAHVVRECTERQYILYFSTFMGQWRDWLEADTGTVFTPTIDLSDAGFEG